MGGHHHHHHSVNDFEEEGVDSKQRYKDIKRVTFVAILVNIFLAIGKISLGFIGQSQALVADGVHSLADLVSDVIVIVAAKEASKEADEEHPYGHGRIETVVEVLLGAFLIIVAAGIMIDASSRIVDPERLLSPTWFALLAAILSILANESLFQYTIKIANKINSNMLRANAWHHRTDAISSIIALVGIAGSMMGWQILDAIAAIGVSLLISKVGWDISWRSLRELIDTALEPERVDKIRDVILAVDGVKAVHSLRTRSMGGYALVDVHILVVNSRISVSEGHLISDRVIRALKREIDEVSDVTVHIDPEDDETVRPSGHLPLRGDVEQKLESYFADNRFFAERKRMILHYLDGQIHIELELPLSVLKDGQDPDKISSSFTIDENCPLEIAEVTVKYS